MRRFSVLVGLALALVGGSVWAQASVTVIDLDLASAAGIRIEGLVADQTGQYLYTSDLASRRLFRITPSTGAVDALGQLPQPSSGMAFDKNGWLYIASGTSVLRVPGDKLAHALYASNFDIERGANSPAASGEGASIARIAVGVGGATLPVAQPLPAPAPTAAAPQQPAQPAPPQVPATLPNTAGERTLPTVLMVLALAALVAGATLLRVRP